MQIIDLEISTEEFAKVSNGESISANEYFNLLTVLATNFPQQHYYLAENYTYPGSIPKCPFLGMLSSIASLTVRQ